MSENDLSGYAEILSKLSALEKEVRKFTQCMEKITDTTSSVVGLTHLMEELVSQQKEPQKNQNNGALEKGLEDNSEDEDWKGDEALENEETLLLLS
mmetsp:Transcript_7219/g.10782  ORF Transcript_7219/g.10782 Transcript_7219/m.10782 type:complete len:96 (-) Transcript_7219:35-322(-)